MGDHMGDQVEDKYPVNPLFNPYSIPSCIWCISFCITTLILMAIGNNLSQMQISMVFVGVHRLVFASQVIFTPKQNTLYTNHYQKLTRHEQHRV